MQRIWCERTFTVMSLMSSFLEHCVNLRIGVCVVELVQ